MVRPLPPPPLMALPLIKEVFLRLPLITKHRVCQYLLNEVDIDTLFVKQKYDNKNNQVFTG